MRKTLAAGLVAGALMGAVAVAPASADAPTGTLTITFTKKTWKAINSEMMVAPTGKATKVGTGSYAFPAYSYDQYTIASRGGLKFVRATAGLKMKNFDIDLANDEMAADVVGIGTDYALFDLANVKQAKKTKGVMNLADGEQTMLNEALKTDIFTKGMKIGTFVYTYK